jgi:hypothetical protein
MGGVALLIWAVSLIEVATSGDHFKVFHITVIAVQFEAGGSRELILACGESRFPAIVDAVQFPCMFALLWQETAHSPELSRHSFVCYRVRRVAVMKTLRHLYLNSPSLSASAFETG